MASCAAAALSTPPLMATSVRSARGASRGAPSRAASPMARCSASAVRSAAWAAAGESVPSRSEMAAGVMRAASSSGRPSHQLDGGAAGGAHRGATAGVESRLRHAVLLERAPKRARGRRRPRHPRHRSGATVPARRGRAGPRGGRAGRARASRCEPPWAQHRKGGLQLAAAGRELGLLLQAWVPSGTSLAANAWHVPSRAPIPLVLAQRMGRLANKLEPGGDASSVPRRRGGPFSRGRRRPAGGAARARAAGARPPAPARL